MRKLLNILLWPLGCKITRKVEWSREIKTVEMTEASFCDPRTASVGMGYKILDYEDVQMIYTHLVIWGKWHYLISIDIWRGLLPPDGHWNCRCVGG